MASEDLGPMGAVKPAREPRHRAIDGAVDRLRNSVDGLESLKDRIKGEDKPTACQPEVTCPNLLSVLNCTPSRIHECCDQINALVVEISEDLF